MTDQDTIDQMVLQEIRPPGGGPQGLDEIVHTLTTMRRHGIALPPITHEAVRASLQRLADRRQAIERDGTWEFTPINAPRQHSLF
jgi:hypothetical protein